MYAKAYLSAIIGNPTYPNKESANAILGVFSLLQFLLGYSQGRLLFVVSENPRNFKAWPHP